MSCFVWQCSLHLAALAVAFGGCGEWRVETARDVLRTFSEHIRTEFRRKKSKTKDQSVQSGPDRTTHRTVCPQSFRDK